MSLKTDFFDGSTGFNQQMDDVFDQGVAFVTQNLTALTADLQTAASQGKKSFTLTYVTVFEPQSLRLKGFHLKCYLAGIQAAMSEQDVYPHECALALNTSDTMETKIDFIFSF